MVLAISSQTQLTSYLAPDSAIQDVLAEVDELWLSAINPDTEFTGAYVKVPLSLSDHHAMEAMELWTQFAERLAIRKQPLAHLALHCTAQYWISRGLDVRAPRSAHDDLLASHARKTQVRDLTLSGQCYRESYWPYLDITQRIAVRGCIHTFRDELFARLADVEATVPVLELHCLGYVQHMTGIGWLQGLAHVQRTRHLLGLKQFVDSGGDASNYPAEARHFKSVVFKLKLDCAECQEIQDRWAHLPKVYTEGTKLTVVSLGRFQLGQGSETPNAIQEGEKRIFLHPHTVKSTSRNVSDSSIASCGSSVQVDSWDSPSERQPLVEATGALSGEYPAVAVFQEPERKSTSARQPNLTQTASALQPSVQHEPSPEAQDPLKACGCSGQWENDANERDMDRLDLPSSIIFKEITNGSLWDPVNARVFEKYVREQDFEEDLQDGLWVPLDELETDETDE